MPKRRQLLQGWHDRDSLAGAGRWECRSRRRGDAGRWREARDHQLGRQGGALEKVCTHATACCRLSRNEAGVGCGLWPGLQPHADGREVEVGTVAWSVLERNVGSAGRGVLEVACNGWDLLSRGGRAKRVALSHSQQASTTDIWIGQQLELWH